MRPSSRLIHAARRDSLPANTVNPPLHRGSTVLFDCHADLLRAGRGEYEGITYGTDRLPLQRILEETLRDLEGAALTRVFPSGISAISETLMAFLRAGDHVLVCDNAYGPTTRFCTEVLEKFGVRFQAVPPDIGAGITEYLRPETRLVFLESPGSITFEIQDIPAITAVARERGIVTVLDNSWATPLFLRPFELGVDVIIQSVTKYISGHSDVLMGSASVTEKHAETLERFYASRETYASPEDCQLALRGLRTLDVRMRAHQASALNVAAALAEHPLVDRMLHPALPSHPQHALWKRDFRGSSGLFSFTLRREYPEADLGRFVDSLELFGVGFSWGGYASLISTGRPARHFAGPLRDRTLVRLNIGLEDPQDLLEDLLQGLGRLSHGNTTGEHP
jgi:cystathionine beta-lyase